MKRQVAKASCAVVSIWLLAGPAHGVTLRQCVESTLRATYKTPAWIVSRHDPTAVPLKQVMRGLFQETNHHHLNKITNWMEHHFFTQMLFRNVTWLHNVVRSPWTRWSPDEARSILKNLYALNENLVEAGHPLKARNKIMALTLDTEILAKGRFPLPGRAAKMVARALRASSEEQAIAALNQGLRSMPRRTYDFTPYYALLNLMGMKNLATWSSHRTVRLPFRIVQAGAWWGIVGFPLIYAPVAKWMRHRPQDERFDGKPNEDIDAFNESRRAFYGLLQRSMGEFDQAPEGQERARLRSIYIEYDRLAQAQGARDPELRRKRDEAKARFEEADTPYQIFLNVKLMKETLGLQIPDLIEPESSKPWDELTTTFAATMAMPHAPLFGDFRKKYLGSLTSMVWPDGMSPFVKTIPSVLSNPEHLQKVAGLTGPGYFMRLKEVIYPMYVAELRRIHDDTLLDYIPYKYGAGMRFEAAVDLEADKLPHEERQRLLALRSTGLWKTLASDIEASTPGQREAAISRLKNVMRRYTALSAEAVQLHWLAHGEKAEAPTDFSSIEASLLRERK